jgi:carbamoyl-phosphate synthase large subunit
LTEASGSLSAAYLIKAIQSSGNVAIASDISLENAGRYIANDFIQMPAASDKAHWKKVAKLINSHDVEMVIPSLDETLLGWSDASYLSHLNNDKKPKVLVSKSSTLNIFLDKWKAFNFFRNNGIPTPNTSLEQEFPLIKPRFGRGGKGVKLSTCKEEMEGQISQELITGIEYTVDVLCDSDSNPIYIVPRKRIKVIDGKSTHGEVVDHPVITKLVRFLCSRVHFCGPINIQCFVNQKEEVIIIEVNPRIAGGMALGFAATENWIPLMINIAIGNNKFKPVPIKYGMQMMRYYNEIFISKY